MKWHRWIPIPASCFITVLLFLTILVSPAQALVIKLSLDQLAAGADSVVVGTVVELTSRWNADRSHIETLVTISVEERLKGAPGDVRVTITVPGGQVGEIREMVSDTPGFQVGERVAVF